MQTFLQFSLNGLGVGSIYALMSLSIVLIYKSTKVFNFATGQMMMIGAFICWSLIEWNVPMWFSLPIVLGTSYLLGLVVERLVMRPLIGQPLIGAMLATLVLGELLHGLGMLSWGGWQRKFATPFFPLTKLEIGGAYLSGAFIGALIVSVIIFIVAAFLYQRTHIGLSMRATAESHMLAQSKGIRVHTIFALTWAVSAIVCSLAGIILSDVLALGITESAGVVYKAFPAILLGGLESILGALVGGLVIGLAENIAGGYISPLFAQIVPYIVLLVILVIRPEGIWGLKRIERI
jgi:branched-chain amino acid transport system permease protein